MFGIVPTLQCTRIDIRSSLIEGSVRATPSRGQRTTLGALIICQIAFALVLSISAGLLVQAFRKVLSVDPGFRPENVLLFRISLPDLIYEKPDQRINYYDTFLARLESVPGVKAVAATSAPPLDGHWGGVYEADQTRDNISSDEKPTVLQIAVTPRYVDAIGMTLLAGRTFNEQDDKPGSPMVVMVNETFAKHFWGSRSPIGRRIRRPGAMDGSALFNSWFEVVGLLRDERHDGLDQKVAPSVFLPLSKAVRAADANDARALREINFVIRGASDPEMLFGAAHEIAHQLNPDLPIYNVQTLQDRLDASLWVRQAYSRLFEAFAIVAVILAMAGVYGVMSYAVSQRVHEFGIRMALGARPRHVLRQVLAQGMTLVVCGIVLGLINALWATGVLRSLLFGVNSRDLFIYTSAVLAIASAGLIASLRPAIRAAKVDPMRVLSSS